MNNQDVDFAITELYTPEGGTTAPAKDITKVCKAIDVVLPILNVLANRVGWKFWHRWALGVVIFALEDYRNNNCK